MRECLIIILLFTNTTLFAQLKLQIHSNKVRYSYGEKIYLTADLSNTLNEQITIWFGSSCQAEFSFDDYNSYEWVGCFPTIEQVVIDPYGARRYNWIVDPFKVGFPKQSGSHEIVGLISFYLEPPLVNNVELKDTITIEAPKFYGGQLYVSFYKSAVERIDQLKSILDVLVLDSYTNSNIDYINETWQIFERDIDSLRIELLNEEGIKYTDPARDIGYDSITKLEDEITPDVFELKQNYPNPFNPTTTIEYTIPEVGGENLHPQQSVKLIVYDILGREVAILVNRHLPPGKYEIKFNASNLSSGVYYYRLSSRTNDQTRKMVLLK